MTTYHYLNLAKGAPARLALLRSLATDWREARKFTLRTADPVLCAGRNGKEPIVYAFREYFRDETDCNDVDNAGIRHDGWYCDPDQDGTARGIIARLTHDRFIAGYCLSLNGERVWFPRIHDSEIDAARMANEHARVIAEQEMEYQTRWREARDLEDSIAEKLQRLRECLALRHVECMSYVRREIEELIEAIRDARETLATQYGDVA